MKQRKEIKMEYEKRKGIGKARRQTMGGGGHTK